MLALALAAGVLTTSAAAMAADGKVTVLHGLSVANAAVVNQNEGGTGLVVYRGPATSVLRKSATPEPVATIGRKNINIDSLEPSGSWFLDRSKGRLSVVHCYSKQSMYVGRARRIRCNSREF